jgi:serine/threonine protein kinase/Tol biopolymer transport system component
MANRTIGQDLLIGQNISHYRIVEKLGEGGMGVVYKARDTHLDRFVAIKVLPPEKVADPQRKARFVQEAKAASALNHPNIVTIHDISSEDGHDFIAMEYVAGKTLEQLIPRKGMRLNEALRIAVQIADALGRAHAAGIVHRDLKPGNVMVDDHGRVKVLDFGLAKLTENPPLGADERTQTLNPATEEGTIVGTLAYMSPEQAEGKQVDARSDIFSFGAVLYEMLTGRRAFQGDSKASTLAAVLSREPAPLGAEIPRDVERIVTRCLRKSPERRYQHLADVKVELEDLKEESDSGSLVGQPVRVVRRKPSFWLIAAVAVPVLAVGGWIAWQRLRAPVPAPRVVALTSYPGIERYPAFSPDGRQIAFSWNGEKQDNEDIYVRLVGSGAPLRLTTDPAPDTSPAWSPDGTQIAFLRTQGDQTTVYITPALGGQERKVFSFHPVPSLGLWYLTPTLRWSPDGQWLAIPQLDSGDTNAISLVHVGRGEQRRLVSSQVTAGRLYWPTFSPKGDLLAYAACPGERSCDVNLLELGRDYAPKGGPRRLTRQGATVEGIAFTADGQALIYGAALDLASSSFLWRVPVSGSAQPERVEITGGGAIHPAVSPDGTRLAYSRSEPDVHIWQFREGAAPRPVLSSTNTDVDPAYSPDGKRVAFSTARSGKGSELWVANADGTNPIGLTDANGRMLGSPRWSPDGRWIAFDAQGEDGHWDVYLIDSAGGQPRCLTPPQSDENLPSWSRDGKWIYFASNRTGRYEIWRMPAGGGESVQITTEGGLQSAESWDGKTLYYSKDLGYSRPLFARPLAGGAERKALESVVGLSFAVAEDGIYYVYRPEAISSFGFEIRFRDSATGKDRVLYRSELAAVQGLAVSPDRKTILYCAAARINANLMMVENFR